MPQPEFKRKLFGRKKGRKLSLQTQELIDTLFKKNLDIKRENLGVSESYDPQKLFSFKPQNIIAEIGFGNGDMLAVMHKENPDDAFIGCEPFLNGLGNLLMAIEENDTRNLRLWQDDALLLLRQFTDNSLDKIYILNPDPWPKKRHHKRRIVRPETLDLYARLLKKGGQLIMTTDVDDLAEWMVTQASNHDAFKWTANSKTDWQNAPEGWVKTKYERKGEKAGRRQSYLLFKKNN